MVPAPLLVVGPAGTAAFAGRTVEMLRDDIRYRLAHHADLTWEPTVEAMEVESGEVGIAALDQAGLRVRVGPTDHRPVAPTVAYRVEHDGRSVVLAGDTVPCEGLDELLVGADVYVQTVIRDDLIRRIPVPRLHDVCDYHSTVQDAARTARRAGVGTLVLTHMVPAPPAGDVAEWIELARAEFSGRVVAPDDLGVVEVPAG